MSLDLQLRINSKVPIDSIEPILLQRGWRRIDLKDVNAGFFWFIEKQYVSTRGCRLYVSYNEAFERREFPTLVSTISNSGRSYEDLQEQNEVLRHLKKALGGSIYNPQTCNGAYIGNTVTRLTSREKGLGLAFVHFGQNIGRVRLAVDEIGEQAQRMRDLDAWFLSFDKGLIRNNLLVAFLVASIESFLKDFFTIFLETTPEVRNKLFEKKTKLELSEVRDVLEGFKTIEQLEASRFTFQNLFSANLAYREYVGIDLFEILKRRRRIGSRCPTLRQWVSELIELRHKIVHNAFLDLNLDKGSLLNYARAVEIFKDEFSVEVFKKKGLRIDIENHL